MPLRQRHLGDHLASIFADEESIRWFAAQGDLKQSIVIAGRKNCQFAAAVGRDGDAHRPRQWALNNEGEHTARRGEGAEGERFDDR